MEAAEAVWQLFTALAAFGFVVAGFARLNLRENTWWPAVGLIIIGLAFGVAFGSL